jgi:hypothetical protein
MRTLNRLFLLAVLGLTLQACNDSNDGPLEQSGETLDQAAQNAAEQAENAAEQAGEAAERIQQQTPPNQ